MVLGGICSDSGVSTTGTGAARAFGGLGFNYANSGLAISGNAFFTFTVKANSGYKISLSSIDPFDYRRSGTGAISALVQYQINAGSFIDITTLSLSSSSSAGASAGPVDLSTITALQNLTSSSTVTFRIVPYGASGATGTFYIFDVAVSTASDLSVNGTVALDCVPPSITSATAGASPICSNATTTLTATVTGTNPSVTWWTGAGGTGTQVGTGLVSNPVGPGTYHAYATGDCGTDDETVIVTGQAAPNAGTNGTLTICEGSTVTAAQLFAQLGGTPDAGGNWTPVLAGAGVYTYTVTATSPCTTNATATVTVSEQAAPDAGSNGTLTICEGSTVTAAQLFAQLGGTPDAGGNWTPVLAGAGVYTYTVTATSPCTTNATATVTVSEQAAPDAGSNGTLTICDGTNITADAAQSVAQLAGTPDTGGNCSAPGRGIKYQCSNWSDNTLYQHPGYLFSYLHGSSIRSMSCLYNHHQCNNQSLCGHAT